MRVYTPADPGACVIACRMRGELGDECCCCSFHSALSGTAVLSKVAWCRRLLGTGVSYTPTENVELRLAGSVGILTSGSSGPVDFEGQTIGNEVTYDFDNDFVGAISTSLKVRF